MILIPEAINSKKVIYLEVKDDLNELRSIDLNNCVLFVIEDDEANPVLWPFAELCIDKELLYMAAVGKACSKIDDVFDMAMVLRELEGRKLPHWMVSSKDVLMTTWHDDFSEGFWFITSVASYENFQIDTVVVANMTSTNYLPVVKDLAIKINNNWLPPE